MDNEFDWDWKIYKWLKKEEEKWCEQENEKAKEKYYE